LLDYFIEIFYVQYRISGTLFDYLVVQDCVYCHRHVIMMLGKHPFRLELAHFFSDVHHQYGVDEWGILVWMPGPTYLWCTCPAAEYMMARSYCLIIIRKAEMITTSPVIIDAYTTASLSKDGPIATRTISISAVLL
jgi:hypothetical protein